MRAKWLVLLIALFSIAALSGCGSGGGGGSEVAGGDDAEELNVTTLGTSNCLKCHSPNSPETFSWLMSTHANPNERPGRSGPAGPDSSCAPCHNQLQEGQLLPEIFAAPYNVAIDGDTTADVARNITTCESCHGGGSAHRGVGPIPYPRPDWEQCVDCHDHPEGIRHADDYGLLASSVGASAHNNSDNLRGDEAKCQRCHTAEGSVAWSEYTGDKVVMDLLEDLEVAGDIEPLEEVHTVTCATCHIPHDDSGRWEEEITLNYEVDSVTYNSAWDPNENSGPDQFDFCTSCHTFYNQDGVMVGSGSTASGTAPYYHNTSWYRTITSTHYDDPTTGYDLAENILEGYVIREDSGSPCFDCHGHELRTNTRRSRDIPDADEETPQDYGPTIHTQWASSRHGANLLEAKYQANDDNPVTGSRGTDEFTNTSIARVDAVMMAGREDEVGEGWSWTHYDWDAMAGGFSGTGRQGCQRCHTSTGTSNYAQDPSTYDPANNDFSHLANWPSGATSSSPQNEMLYCWGCHSNPGTGYLYPLSEVPPDADEDPEYGGIVEDYAGEGVIVTYPDIDHSNTCMVCHLGREIGENVNNVADFTNTGFVNSHYLAAGASVFGVSGYEYPGLNYANPAIYAHDAIGTAFEVNAYPNEADLAATDNDMGPCVGCHMTAEDGSHNFLPFELTEDGSAFEYLTPVCAECHTVGSPYEITPALIEEEEEGYEAAIAALNGALQEIGIFYAPDYPYFFQDSGFGGGIAGNGILEPEEIDRDNGIDDWVMNADNTYPVGQDLQEAGAFNMGAAFNMNLAAHDPGGFAHNRFYYKRLIWDSIDWADDFMFNDSVPTAIDDLETAGSIDAAQALHAADYLGDARPTAGPDRAAIPGLDVTTSF